MYFTLGASQAMRTAWFEDILSLVPPIAFLVAARFEDRESNEDFPYGYHRTVSIAFVVASVALAGMGAFLLYESVLKLLHDGWVNLRQGIEDLMDQTPTTIEKREPDPLPDRMREALCRTPWVKDAAVRLREEGHVLTGEVFVVPLEEIDLVTRLDQAARELEGTDWRLYDLAVVPVRSLEEDEGPRDGPPVST